jgi:hypothetical protein
VAYQKVSNRGGDDKPCQPLDGALLEQEEDDFPNIATRPYFLHDLVWNNVPARAVARRQLTRDFRRVVTGILTPELDLPQQEEYFERFHRSNSHWSAAGTKPGNSRKTYKRS